MEEGENIEKTPEVEVKQEQEQKQEKGSCKLKTFNYKKFIPYMAVVLTAIILVIVLVSVLGGGPKKAVKKFISGINKQNATKVLDSYDPAGLSAWKFTYDVEDFSKEEYKEFTENYNDFDKSDLKEEKEELKESMEGLFEEIKEECKKFEIKVEKFKDVKKLGKDLYAVDAKISIYVKPKDKEEMDEVDESSVMTYVVYKNKIIAADDLGLF